MENWRGRPRWRSTMLSVVPSATAPAGGESIYHSVPSLGRMVTMAGAEGNSQPGGAEATVTMMVSASSRMLSSVMRWLTDRLPVSRGMLTA